MNAMIDIHEYPQLIDEVFVSEWVLVDQARIQAFADATLDQQFIHVNPEQAAQTPFGGTIAHGLLTLSLLPHLCASALPKISGLKMGVNYGFNKVRFVSPVPSGCKVRAHIKIQSFTSTAPQQHQLITEIQIEIDGHNKPALIAEWINLFFT